MMIDVEINLDEKKVEGLEISDVKDVGLLSEFVLYIFLYGFYFVVGLFILIWWILWVILLIVGIGLLILLCVERYGKFVVKYFVIMKEY